MDLESIGLAREPGGRLHGLLLVGCGLAFFGIYAYYSVVRGYTSQFPILLGLVWILMGVPKLLPAGKRRLALVLRVVAIAAALAVVAYALFVY